MEATEIMYLSETVENVEETIATVLNDLRTATEAKKDQVQYNQVVVSLYPDEKDGHTWLMFVYYETASSSFYCSFQNEEFYDTDFDYNYDLEQMAAHIKAEIDNVGGFNWISRDLD